jgi:hypothetical protein
MILNQCVAHSRHGFWSAVRPVMRRYPAAHNWHLRVMAIEPGLLVGRGVNRNCRVCGASVIPVGPEILAEAERQRALL